MLALQITRPLLLLLLLLLRKEDYFLAIKIYSHREGNHCYSTAFGVMRR